MVETATAALQRIRESIAAGAEIPVSALDELILLATESDEAIARSGLTAIFPGLIEWLNDSFTPQAAFYYNEIFAQIIDSCRHHQAGSELDQWLHRYELPDRPSLLRRFEQLPKVMGYDQFDRFRLRRVIWLSRVTIGADIAVTSVLMDGLRRALPDPDRVEMVLVGPGKLVELYGGDPQIRIREVEYRRGGTLFDRLLSWRSVVTAVETEISGLDEGEYLVIDPDSRLTQLGLLPVLPPAVESRGYRFFPSRIFTAPDCSSLGELAAAWTADSGITDSTRSFIAPPARFIHLGRSIADRLRKMGAEQIVTVSLGVGGNEEKRRGESFEIDLLGRLCREGWVILDRGFTPDEERQVEAAIAPWRRSGLPILTADEDQLPSLNRPATSKHGILTWRGGIGSLAGLIAASDRYVGYDSSGQHLAAALEIPGITYFSSNNPAIFARRWAPFSQKSQVVTE